MDGVAITMVILLIAVVSVISDDNGNTSVVTIMMTTVITLKIYERAMNMMMRVTLINSCHYYQY